MLQMFMYFKLLVLMHAKEQTFGNMAANS